jgi:ABC-type transport system involved in multi-copper enzyme maturation permease subunit
MKTADTGAAMVRLLVRKDWYFLRWPIAAYLLAGGLALALIGRGGEGAFFAGSVLLVTVLISVGIHLPMATVVEERKDQTLPFVMSLPISPREYTTAKILANLGIFLIPWVVLVVGSLAVIAGRAALPDGLIPFTVLVLGEILVATCLILAVALVSESQGWTIGAIVAGNLGFQAFLYGVSHLPSISQAMKGQDIVWSPAAVGILTAELAAVVALLAATFYLQSRKTDFV